MHIYNLKNLRKGVRNIIWPIFLLKEFLEVIPNGTIQGWVYPNTKSLIFVYFKWKTFLLHNFFKNDPLF